MMRGHSGLRRKVAVVIPLLNEEENLPVLYERLSRAMAGEPEALEVVFVDDGSSDRSAGWIKQQALQDSRVKLLQLSRTFGHQIAITAGLDVAEGDAVVVMDGDLQDPPELVPELLKKWREGYEVVYAVRASRKGESWLKKLLAAGFYRIFRRLVEIDVPLDVGDFRLLDRKPLDALRQLRERHRFVRGLTCWVGFRQTAVQYHRDPRYSGRTKYPLLKLLNLALDGVTSFSAAPLRWMMVGGIAVSILGGLEAVRVVISRLLYPETLQPGWATLTALILLLGGGQLACIGLLGQYVGRIFEETKKRPLYVVRETVGDFARVPEVP